MAFRSYGHNAHLYVRGRALEDEEIDLHGKGFLKQLCNSYKRFETDEVRLAPITVTLSDDRKIEGTTDKEGYFLMDEPVHDLASLTDAEGWLAYEIAYTCAPLKREIAQQNRFRGEMLIPSQNADFGVISDIDDTILHTGVVSSLKWQVVLNTFFRSVGNRKPLEGAAQFYHLLHRGPSGERANPIFYVSHSPWNLYRYLELFLEINDFPKGPILLRSMSSFWNKKYRAGIPHKQHEIVNILKTYPGLRFILIGDSGERDADIYLEIARLFPGRILSIYLRNVKHKKRMMRVRDLTERHTGTPIILVGGTGDAVSHARKNKLVK